MARVRNNSNKRVTVQPDARHERGGLGGEGRGEYEGLGRMLGWVPWGRLAVLKVLGLGLEVQL